MKKAPYFKILIKINSYVREERDLGQYQISLNFAEKKLHGGTFGFIHHVHEHFHNKTRISFNKVTFLSK